MSTAADRLKRTRVDAGYRSAAAFARAVDAPEATYRAHENGTRPLTIDAAKIYAPRLGVPWNVLYFGEGAPPVPEQRPESAAILPESAASVNPSELSEASSNVRFPSPPIELPAHADMPKDVPVLGTAQGGSGGAFQLHTDQVIDRVRRPPGLANARDVYAIYVEGDSMEPRFERGEPVFVHPHRPAAIGDYVIVQTRAHEADEVQVYIKRLVKRTEKHLTLAQFNPPVTIRLAQSIVVAVHKVLTPAELWGI